MRLPWTLSTVGIISSHLQLCTAHRTRSGSASDLSPTLTARHSRKHLQGRMSLGEKAPAIPAKTTLEGLEQLELRKLWAKNQNEQTEHSRELAKGG